MEQKSPNKDFYFRALLLIKLLPMLVAMTYILNTTLLWFGIDDILLTYVKEFIIIYYMYVTSYLFRLCWRYRMFIHYKLSCDVINLLDYYFGLPLSDTGVYVLYGVLSGILVFAVLFSFMRR